MVNENRGIIYTNILFHLKYCEIVLCEYTVFFLGKNRILYPSITEYTHSKFYY